MSVWPLDDVRLLAGQKAVLPRFRSPGSLKSTISRAMRIFHFALALLSVFVGGVTSLHAKRIALVIGNAVYDPTKPLRAKPNLHNTREDADLISTTFKELGFDVILLKDATKPSIQNGLLQLKQRGQGASIGLVYFSGHGMEVSGENYVCPIGARLASRTDPDTYHVSLRSILTTMESSGIIAKMVVLDCCRNDPFKPASKSIEVTPSPSTRSGGLAVLDRIPQSTLVMYAAGPGQYATSGGGKNSPFTEIFCSVVKDPKISCFEAFFRVSDHVKKQTGATQQPWVKFDGAADAFRKYTFHGTSPADNDTNTGVVSSGNQDSSAMSEEIARIEKERQDALANGATAVNAADTRLKKANDELSVFLRGWMANQASNSSFAWVSDFALNPKYCYWNQPGGAPASFLNKDRQELIERYPNRTYSVLGDATGEFFDNFQRAVIVISYHYEYQGQKNASGNSFNTLGLSKINNQWKITSYDETVRKNERIPTTSLNLSPLIQLMAQNFTAGWLKNNQSNNANDWVSDFAPSVDYCYKKDGPASHNDLLTGRQELIRKFPTRSYSILDFKLISPNDPETGALLVYTYNYGRVKGKSSLSLTLKREDGKFKITRFDEKVSK